MKLNPDDKSPSFYVIKYDIKWYELGMDITDMSILQPTIVEEYKSAEDAKCAADKFNGLESDKISITLKNKQAYTGNRYIYSYYRGE